MMMMMSTSSSSFHDYMIRDDFLTKTESLSPIQAIEDHFDESFDNINNNYDRRNRSSTVKRPMNAFLLWARGERKRVSSDGYGISQTSLSKLLGETWRRMSVEEKQPFLDMAEALKRQHYIDHPDYRFKLKQRSTTTANKTIAKKQHASTPQRQLSTMFSSSSSSSSSSSYFPSIYFPSNEQHEQSSINNPQATPHPIQPTVLAMCQAVIPMEASSLSTDNNNEWFLKLICQPQPVIVAPLPRTQTSPVSSRRAVRIQIINKHDDIVLPPPTLLPTIPSPLSSSSITIDESTPTLVDYLTDTCTMYNNSNNQEGLAPVLDDTTEYEILHDSSSNHLMDLDQHYEGSGWIDTPLSNLVVNSADIIPTSPYSTYDFLSL